MSNFTKHISYPPTASVVGHPESCRFVMRHAGIDVGTYVRMATILLQVSDGAQVWVSKDVSDDLLASDIDPEKIQFTNVVWPEPRLELYFEDNAIPTFLAHKFTNEEQRVALSRLLGEELTIDPESEAEIGDHFLVHVQAEDLETNVVSLTYKPEEVDKFASGDDLPDGSHDHTGWSAAMSHDEATELRHLTVLLYKVLLFASSVGHEPRRTNEKPTRKQGGKAGFKNRPKMERLIVEYLPQQLKDRASTARNEGSKHRFLGRRGHFRTYRSDRFKEKKGKTEFIQPVAGPDGRFPRKKFIVRKPEKPAMQ